MSHFSRSINEIRPKSNLIHLAYFSFFKNIFLGYSLFFFFSHPRCFLASSRRWLCTLSFRFTRTHTPMHARTYSAHTHTCARTYCTHSTHTRWHVHVNQFRMHSHEALKKIECESRNRYFSLVVIFHARNCGKKTSKRIPWKFFFSPSKKSSLGENNQDTFLRPKSGILMGEILTDFRLKPFDRKEFLSH